MSVASVSMYNSPTLVWGATGLFWTYLSKRLREAGFTHAPKSLNYQLAYDDAWLHPELLFSQTCGFPYVRQLREKGLQLIATPIYDLPGCDGPRMCSFIIVNSASSLQSIEDLRGTRAAINDTGSNSGYNLFRALIAPHADSSGRFFTSVMETGGHLASIDAVAQGQADVAAIDCVTYGNTKRHDPDRLAGVRVIAETPRGPGLPFITGKATSAVNLNILREALADVIAGPELAGVCDILSLRGIALLSESDYEVLADLEREAKSKGYPVIA